MSRIERTLLLATVFVLLGGAAAFGVLTLGSRPPRQAAPGGGAGGGPGAAPAGPRIASGPGSSGPGSEAPAGPEEDATFAGRSGGITPGLRKPSGDDLSDPKRVKELLRAQLSTASPRWDWIAELLGVLEEPLEPDIKRALQNALVHGNAAGAIQAYQKVRDGTVVPDLLRLLDDPNLDAHDRGNLLVALSGIPGADVAQTVTGIESRLTGDYAHDVVYLAAISRVGGAEGARALVDAVTRSSDPSKFGPEVWRSLDLQRSAEASGILAGALRSASLSPAALRAVAELAGRPGASPALVDALLALEVPDQPEAVRRQVLASLAATGSDAAVERLITVASAGADYASVAASALGNTSSASNAARDRMIAAAKGTSDDFLRKNLVEGLGNVKAVVAVPYLAEVLAGSGNDLVRKEAAVALGRIGPGATAAVPALAVAFQSGDEAMRGHVAIALAEIGGDEARGLLEQLRVAEKSPAVKRILEGAFRRIEAKKSRP